MIAATARLMNESARGILARVLPFLHQRWHTAAERPSLRYKIKAFSKQLCKLSFQTSPILLTWLDL